MKKYKSLIVDDERHGRENLKTIISSHCPEIEISGEAPSIEEARNLIIKLQPEVVFLDILLPVHNGFDLLDFFPDRKFAVIFISASGDFGIKAVKARVLDYVLKPIEIGDLKNAIGKIEGYFNSVKNVPEQNEVISKIALSHTRGFSMVSIDKITRLQADDNYTRVFTVDGKQYLISKPLKEFERALPGGHFVRIHRSYMINIQHLKDFSNEDGGIALLNDGVKIPIAKRKNSIFMKALKNFSLMMRT